MFESIPTILKRRTECNQQERINVATLKGVINEVRVRMHHWRDPNSTTTLLEAVLLQFLNANMMISKLAVHGQAVVPGVLVRYIPVALGMGALSTVKVGDGPLTALEFPQEALQPARYWCNGMC